MTDGNFSIITFFGSYMVLKAERLLIKAGVAVETIAAPRYISTECGICIRLGLHDKERALQILADERLEVNEVHDE